MKKILLVFCLAFTATRAYDDYVRNDYYIEMNQAQYKKILDEYDRQLAFFEEHYTGRVDAAAIQSELISDAVVQNEQHWNPLIFLGGYFKDCVVKYNAALSTVIATKKAIATCRFQASKHLPDLLSAPRNIRNSFNTYVNETYQVNLDECGKDNAFSSVEFTDCAISVTDLANNFAIGNQKHFARELDAAVCAAKAHVKALFDCTFTEQSRVVGIISEVNVRINNCLDGKDDCKACEEYTCSKSYNLRVNSTSKTISNPFFDLEHHEGCLMLYANDE